jgi:hypothetical protein
MIKAIEACYIHGITNSPNNHLNKNQLPQPKERCLSSGRPMPGLGNVFVV